jgi:hypothetical protein
MVDELLSCSVHHGNADGIEAGFLDGLNHFARGLGVAPTCFTTSTFKRVTKVPSHDNVLAPLLGRQIHSCSIGSYVGGLRLSDTEEQEHGIK